MTPSDSDGVAHTWRPDMKLNVVPNVVAFNRERVVSVFILHVGVIAFVRQLQYQRVVGSFCGYGHRLLVAGNRSVQRLLRLVEIFNHRGREGLQVELGCVMKFLNP